MNVEVICVIWFKFRGKYMLRLCMIYDDLGIETCGSGLVVLMNLFVRNDKSMLQETPQAWLVKRRSSNTMRLKVGIKEYLMEEKF